MTHQTLLAKLEILKEIGFVFRIPGGSSRKGDHSSFINIYRSNENFEIEILTVPYNPTITIHRLYDEMEFDEVPEGALALKVSEQTGVKIYDPVKIGYQDAENKRREVNTKRHLKLVYATDKYDDSGMRMTPTTDGRLDPPVWMTISDAKIYLCPQHQWILTLLEEHLIKEIMCC